MKAALFHNKQPMHVFFYTCIIVFSISMAGYEVCYSEIIPSDRRITWNPGIPGGIPQRTNVYVNVKDFPFSAAGDGVADDTDSIQRAIDSCPEGMVVYIPSGTYNITRTISFQKGIVLRGDGPDHTLIRMTSSKHLHVFSVGKYTDSPPQASLKGGYEKDSTTLTINTADAGHSAFSVGNYIIVGQSDGSNPLVKRGDCSWGKLTNDIDGDRVSLGQITKITGRTKNTITISPSLYLGKESRYNPFIARVSYPDSVTIHAGIENLRIERTASCNKQGSIITFYSCVYSWIKNVETSKVCGRHIRLFSCFGCEVRENYWHEAWKYTSGGLAYGLSVQAYSSANLITNNIGMYLNQAGVQSETSGGGNVISYNYFDGSWLDESNPNWQIKNIGSHCSHPYMDLVEGNQATQFQLDDIHGSASHYTVFRNHFDTDHTFPSHPSHPHDDTDMTCGIRIDLGYFTNIVGNILGQPDYVHDPTREKYECTDRRKCVKNQHKRHMYVFRTNDPQVYSTTYRHGNYDYATESVIWDSGNPDHKLPDSLYLAEKPAWFGDLNWPPFGPDVDFENNKIPAQIRFEEIKSRDGIPSKSTKNL
jgi:hypothetical protein